MDDSEYQQVKSSLERDYYLHAGLAGAAILPLLIIWIVLLWISRTRKDPARVAFIWLKLLFFIYILALSLTVASDIVHASKVYLDLKSSDELRGQDDVNTQNNADHLKLNLSSAARFLRQFTDSLLLVTLIELGNGFIFALKRKRSSPQKTMRWFALFMAVVIFSVALAQLILEHDVMPKIWDAVGDHDNKEYDDETLVNLANKALAIGYIAAAYTILNCITAISVLVYTSVVLRKYSIFKYYRGCAAIFLAASVLSFVRLVWLMVFNISLRLTYTFVPDNTAWLFLDIFLDIWMFGIVLILLFSIAVKKRKGLWTTRQPWMNGVLPTLVQRASSVDAAAPLKEQDTQG